jgi:hypothetical protein
LEAKVRFEGPHGEAGIAYRVVMKLLQGLEGRGHCVVMDSYFCSIPLFKDLVSKGIYTTSNVCSNRIGLPSHLKNSKVWKRCEQGHIEWTMHESRELSCVMWKDKCPVLSISFHALPIGYPCMLRDEVPHRNGAMKGNSYIT